MPTSQAADNAKSYIILPVGGPQYSPTAVDVQLWRKDGDRIHPVTIPNIAAQNGSYSLINAHKDRSGVAVINLHSKAPGSQRRLFLAALAGAMGFGSGPLAVDSSDKPMARDFAVSLINEIERKIARSGTQVLGVTVSSEVLKKFFEELEAVKPTGPAPLFSGDTVHILSNQNKADRELVAEVERTTPGLNVKAALNAVRPPDAKGFTLAG